jgi:hypothetical protein
VDHARVEGIDRRTALRTAMVAGGAAALWALAPRSARAAPPPSATERRFDQLDGVPLCYWRWTDGTRPGTQPRQLTFASTNDFHARLVLWVRDLKTIAATYGGLRGMDRIVTAGTYVNKPLEHGKGKAFDLDQVRWGNVAVTPFLREHLSSDVRVRRRYLAVDAVCRRHFHWVLDGGYNADHADHLHLDTAGGALLCDRTAKSDTAFVQQVVNAFQGARLPVDGAWGPATQRALDESRRRLGVSGDPCTNADEWRHWLLRVAACGFAGVPFAQAPADQGDLLGDLIDPILGPVEDGLSELLGLLR